MSDPMDDAALDVVDEAETFLAAVDGSSGGQPSVVVVFQPGGPMGAVPVEVPITGLREAVTAYQESVMQGPKAEELAHAERDAALPPTRAPEMVPPGLELPPPKPGA